MGGGGTAPCSAIVDFMRRIGETCPDIDALIASDALALAQAAGRAADRSLACGIGPAIGRDFNAADLALQYGCGCAACVWWRRM